MTRRAEEQTSEESEAPDESNDSGETVRGEVAASHGGRFDFEQAWMVVACALLIAAAVLLYLGRPNAAFVAAALGVSAWFLNMRAGLKRKHDLVKSGGRNWEPRGDEDNE